MRAAFPNPRSAAAFGALLVFCLTLPLTLRVVGLPPRLVLYRGMSHFAGPFDYLRRVVFEEREPVDVVVLGHSLLKLSMDQRQVEDAISREYGRPARVLVAGLNWEGVDMQYFLLRDLLEQRKVRMLVVQMPILAQRSRRPHVQTFRVFRWGDFPGALDGLALRDQASLYAACVLGSPRQLLTLLRPNLVDPAAGGRAPDLRERAGYYGAPFVELNDPPPSLPPEAMIYSAASAANFDFTGDPLNSYQLHFARKIAELARSHGTKLVALHVTLDSENGKDRVIERGFWPELLGSDVTVVGIPPRTLFRGLPAERVHLYYEDEHMNFNGMRYFTKAILPALMRIYAERGAQ